MKKKASLKGSKTKNAAAEPAEPIAIQDQQEPLTREASESFRQYFEGIATNAIAAQSKEGFEEEYGEEDIQIAYEAVENDDFDYLDERELQAAASMQRQQLDERKHMQQIEAEYLKQFEEEDAQFHKFTTEEQDQEFEAMRQVPEDANREWFYHEGLKNMAKVRDMDQKKALENVKQDIVSDYR